MYHAHPRWDLLGIEPDEADGQLEALLVEVGADVLITGHTHVPFVRRLPSGGILVNPGSALVSAPRDLYDAEDDRRGRFAVAALDRDCGAVDVRLLAL